MVVAVMGVAIMNKAIILVAVLLLASCSAKPMICDTKVHEQYQKGEKVILLSTGETVRILTIRYGSKHCDAKGVHPKAWFDVGLEDGHKLHWLGESALGDKVVR